MPTLFDPIQLGAIAAPNRILMAPLTRSRATRAHVPTPIMAEYYAQRASAGLIISEATGISQEGLGFPYGPGIFNEAQIAGWQRVTDAVHNAGGRIVVQLWHQGRVAYPDISGCQPVSASEGCAPGLTYTYEGKKPFVPARALGLEEIPRLLSDYARAAENARKAGFDGVQLHAANGYLVDQFLRDGTNKRSDAYGGSIENRVRLLKEIVQALNNAIGADRVGVRLSPNGEIQGCDDSDQVALFTHAVRTLSDIGISYLELREAGPDGTFRKSERPPVYPLLRKAFNGIMIMNSDLDAAKAQALLDQGLADAVSFGRPFLSNPDLPYRIREGIAWQPDDMATWYTQGPEGYLDYPTAARA